MFYFKKLLEYLWNEVKTSSGPAKQFWNALITLGTAGLPHATWRYCAKRLAQTHLQQNGRSGSRLWFRAAMLQFVICSDCLNILLNKLSEIEMRYYFIILGG